MRKANNGTLVNETFFPLNIGGGGGSRKINNNFLYRPKCHNLNWLLFAHFCESQKDVVSSKGKSSTQFLFIIFVNGPTPASFYFILVLFEHKTVDVSGNRTRFVEGEHANHLTTTTAKLLNCNR